MQQTDGNDAATQDQQAENRSAGPLVTAGQKLTEGARGARVAISGQSGPFKLRPERKATKRDRHARTRVSFFRYGYYDTAFKFFVEHVLDADFVSLPPHQQNAPLNWAASIRATLFARRSSTSLATISKTLSLEQTCWCNSPAHAALVITAS